jgi:hypothetical protein
MLGGGQSGWLDTEEADAVNRWANECYDCYMC